MLSGNNRNPGCNRPRKHGQGLPCATIACFPPACLSSAATLFVQTLEGVEGNERGAERCETKVSQNGSAHENEGRLEIKSADVIASAWFELLERIVSSSSSIFCDIVARSCLFFFYESWVRFWTHDKISTLRDLIVEDGHLVWWHEIFVIVFYVYTYFIIFIRWIE